jgi:hypothetical protein
LVGQSVGQSVKVKKNKERTPDAGEQLADAERDQPQEQQGDSQGRDLGHRQHRVHGRREVEHVVEEQGHGVYCIADFQKAGPDALLHCGDVGGA